MIEIVMIAAFGFGISGFALGLLVGLFSARRWEKIAQNAIKAAENANGVCATWQGIAKDWQTTAEQAVAMIGPTIR